MGSIHLLGVLFLALAYSSAAQNPEPAAADDADSPDEALAVATTFDLGKVNRLNCTPDDAAKLEKLEYVWKKNGKELEKVELLRERYELKEGGGVFEIKGRVQEDDFGKYSCGLANGAPLRAWAVAVQAHAKLQPDTNVVEGQPLKITCKLFGKPYPAVRWTFTNATLNGSDVVEALGGRAQPQNSSQGVDGGDLVFKEVDRADAGRYECRPAGLGSAAATTLRVKDKYAALWPFLGICAEVFVLCAIILVYEKRRTKPELDDSDTDNPDQKKS